ncbi:unnamed protein product [Citrullus colocynthis]|uniref:Reticulon-like protein n=1 Tax=Citrullus colocynthis TaxID=252529 RepID=A0ABP0Y909_9ROSI
MSNSGDRCNFLYFILGDGKVAELMLWKNKRESAAMAAGISGIWLVVEVLDYHFVTLVCHILIILMSPPNAQDFEISESTFTHLFQTFNWLLHNFFEISSGHDFKLFAMVTGSLWLLSVIGELVNSFNLMYIVFVSLQVVPVVYNKYEEKLNQFASIIKSNMDKYFHIIYSNFLSKIPRSHQIKQS